MYFNLLVVVVGFLRVLIVIAGAGDPMILEADKPSGFSSRAK